MILYHGSNVIVKQPIIIQSEKGRDFGCAFYLTPIKEQAERMAMRKKKEKKSEDAYVSVFEWDESKDGLLYKELLEPNLEWLELIIECRTKPKYKHGFDIVEGKIADDNVGETILFVINDVMRKEDALERLKFQKIISQIAFCSEQSLKHLQFIKSYKV